MKIFLILSMVFITSASFAKEDKKIYTQEEFDKKVHKKLMKRVDKIKRKSIAQLTKELLEKQRKLEQREKELDQREEQIQINEKTLANKIMDLEGDQKKLLGCLDEHQEGQVRRVKQMVSVISNMRPAKAAEVLSVQDSHISVKILELIKPEKASRIFNLMDKEVSARLQKQYLNMRK